MSSPIVHLQAALQSLGNSPAVQPEHLDAVRDSLALSLTALPGASQALLLFTRLPASHALALLDHRGPRLVSAADMFELAQAWFNSYRTPGEYAAAVPAWRACLAVHVRHAHPATLRSLSGRAPWLNSESQFPCALNVAADCEMSLFELTEAAESGLIPSSWAAPCTAAGAAVSRPGLWLFDQPPKRPASIAGFQYNGQQMHPVDWVRDACCGVFWQLELSTDAPNFVLHSKLGQPWGDGRLILEDVWISIVWCRPGAPVVCSRKLPHGMRVPGSCVVEAPLALQCPTHHVSLQVSIVTLY